jgi:hypothetical protein
MRSNPNERVAGQGTMPAAAAEGMRWTHPDGDPDPDSFSSMKEGMP